MKKQINAEEIIKQIDNLTKKLTKEQLRDLLKEVKEILTNESQMI